MSGRWCMIVLLSTMLSAAQSGAQGARGGPDGPLRGPASREAMEQRVRQGMWRVAKQRVGLTDDQMAKLARSSARYDGRRRGLIQEERQLRQALRAQVVAGPTADQARIAGALDRLHQLQRARLDVQMEEQREFATFMTPLQRARYLALQEQVRRRVETLRVRGGPAGRRIPSANP